MVNELETRIDVCRRRWEAAPVSRAFLPLADLLRQAGRPDEALAVLEAGLARHPEAVGGLVTLARPLAAAGRGEDAADAAVQVLALDPDNTVALELLADAEERAGDLAAALAHCERLAQLEPGDPHWAASLARLRDAWSAGTAVGPDGRGGGGFATLTLVDLCLEQGYRDKAVRLLRRLAAERPGDPAVAARLAELDPDGVDGPYGGDDPEGAGEAGAWAAGGPAARRPAVATVGAGGAARREAAREQFTRWLDRIRAEREATS